MSPLQKKTNPKTRIEISIPTESMARKIKLWRDQKPKRDLYLDLLFFYDAETCIAHWCASDKTLKDSNKQFLEHLYLSPYRLKYANPFTACLLSQDQDLFYKDCYLLKEYNSFHELLLFVFIASTSLFQSNLTEKVDGKLPKNELDPYDISLGGDDDTLKYSELQLLESVTRKKLEDAQEKIAQLETYIQKNCPVKEDTKSYKTTILYLKTFQKQSPINPKTGRKFRGKCPIKGWKVEVPLNYNISPNFIMSKSKD